MEKIKIQWITDEMIIEENYIIDLKNKIDLKIKAGEKISSALLLSPIDTSKLRAFLRNNGETGISYQNLIIFRCLDIIEGDFILL